MNQSSHRTFVGYVAHFSITKAFDDRGVASFDVEIVLAAEWGPSSLATKLRFAGARAVRYGEGQDGIDFGAYLFLSVTDVADTGWEGIRFEVKNIEDERFSLYCRDFKTIAG
jgi:hypothetical protein